MLPETATQVKATQDQYLCMYACMDIHLLPQTITQGCGGSVFSVCDVFMYRHSYITSGSDTSEGCG